MRVYTVEGNVIKWEGNVNYETVTSQWSVGVMPCELEWYPDQNLAEFWGQGQADDYVEHFGVKVENGQLTEWDGAFEIPFQLILLLEAHGINCNKVRQDHIYEGEEDRWTEIPNVDYILLNHNPVPPKLYFTDEEIAQMADVVWTHITQEPTLTTLQSRIEGWREVRDGKLSSEAV